MLLLRCCACTGLDRQILWVGEYFPILGIVGYTACLLSVSK
jgi:hypothetical protein